MRRPYHIGVELPPHAKLPDRPWWAKLLGLYPEWFRSTDSLGVPFIEVRWRRR